jgi:hypothetical protein
MPTVLFLNGFRFFFYSNENNEPAHIHVEKGDAAGKIWLEPITEIAWMRGFTNAEEKGISDIVTEYQQLFKNKWNEYFGK